MGHEEFQKKHKEAQPVVAICYDFDKTLSPDDMQAQGFIQSVGYDVGDFWKASNGLATNNAMDQNLAYMYMMKAKSAGKVLFTKRQLTEYGTKVQLFPGVQEWFERIRAYGKEKSVIVEHYIIRSSGWTPGNFPSTPEIWSSLIPTHLTQNYLLQKIH